MNNLDAIASKLEILNIDYVRNSFAIVANLGNGHLKFYHILGNSGIDYMANMENIKISVSKHFVSVPTIENGKYHRDVFIAKSPNRLKIEGRILVDNIDSSVDLPLTICKNASGSGYLVNKDGKILKVKGLVNSVGPNRSRRDINGDLFETYVLYVVFSVIPCAEVTEDLEICSDNCNVFLTT